MVFTISMSKKYTYTKSERKAEREIDTFLQALNYSASAGASILEDLRVLSAES